MPLHRRSNFLSLDDFVSDLCAVTFEPSPSFATKPTVSTDANRGLDNQHTYDQTECNPACRQRPSSLISSHLNPPFRSDRHRRKLPLAGVTNSWKFSSESHRCRSFLARGRLPRSPGSPKEITVPERSPATLNRFTHFTHYEPIPIELQ